MEPCTDENITCFCCRKSSALFSALTDEEIQLIRERRRRVVFKKGETICKQGTPISHVLSFNEGLAKLFLEGIDDRPSILQILKPVYFLGGSGIFIDWIYHYTVTALIESTVCFVDVTLFLQLINENSKFANAYMKYLSKNILSMQVRLVNLTQKQVPGRMADTLIYLSEEIYDAKIFKLNLSKQELADLSGMSKDSALKVLRDFQRSGIINFSDVELEIVNPDELVRISKIG